MLLRRQTKCACGGELRPRQADCKACHAAYMKAWRKDRIYVAVENKPVRPKHPREVCLCGNPKDPDASYCPPCKNQKQKEYRERNPLQGEALAKAHARSYSAVYVKRGRLPRCGCEVCGAKAEIHHDDYRDPLKIRWLCREHHLDLHYDVPHGTSVTPSGTPEAQAGGKS